MFMKSVNAFMIIRTHYCQLRLHISAERAEFMGLRPTGQPSVQSLSALALQLLSLDTVSMIAARRVHNCSSLQLDRRIVFCAQQQRGRS